MLLHCNYLKLRIDDWERMFSKVTSIKVESSGLTASLATTFLNFSIEAFNMSRTSSHSLDRAPDKMGRRIVLNVVCYRTAHSLNIGSESHGEIPQEEKVIPK